MEHEQCSEQIVPRVAPTLREEIKRAASNEERSLPTRRGGDGGLIKARADCATVRPRSRQWEPIYDLDQKQIVDFLTYSHLSVSALWRQSRPSRERAAMSARDPKRTWNFSTFGRVHLLILFSREGRHG
jgi:hypothetical protein